MGDTYNGNGNYGGLSDKDRFFKFFRSKPGVLLGISFVLNLLTLIFLIALYAILGYWPFLLTLVILIFAYQVLVTLLFTKGYNQSVTEVNWPLTVMINTIIASFMLFLANIIAIATGWTSVPFTLARFSSLANCAILAYKAFVEFEDWRAKRQQGQTQVSV